MGLFSTFQNRKQNTCKSNIALLRPVKLGYYDVGYRIGLLTVTVQLAFSWSTVLQLFLTYYVQMLMTSSK